MFKIRFCQHRFVIIAFFCTIAHTVGACGLSWYGIKPDIMLLLVMFFSLYHEPVSGMYCGLAVGFFYDVLSGGIMGAQMVAYAGVGFLCGFIREQVYVSHLVIRLGACFAFCVLSGGVYYLCAGRYYQVLPPLRFLALTARVAVYTAAVNVLFAELMERLCVQRVRTLH